MSMAAPPAQRYRDASGCAAAAHATRKIAQKPLRHRTNIIWGLTTFANYVPWQSQGTMPIANCLNN